MSGNLARQSTVHGTLGPRHAHQQPIWNSQKHAWKVLSAHFLKRLAGMNESFLFFYSSIEVEKFHVPSFLFLFVYIDSVQGE